MRDCGRYFLLRKMHHPIPQYVSPNLYPQYVTLIRYVSSNHVPLVWKADPRVRKPEPAPRVCNPYPQVRKLKPVPSVRKADPRVRKPEPAPRVRNPFPQPRKPEPALPTTLLGVHASVLLYLSPPPSTRPFLLFPSAYLSLLPFSSPLQPPPHLPHVSKAVRPFKNSHFKIKI